ncbi:MAG: hypothetical protein ABSB40_01150 [Nitrososphaeria archaeon]
MAIKITFAFLLIGSVAIATFGSVVMAGIASLSKPVSEEVSATAGAYSFDFMGLAIILAIAIVAVAYLTHR